MCVYHRIAIICDSALWIILQKFRVRKKQWMNMCFRWVICILANVRSTSMPRFCESGIHLQRPNQTRVFLVHTGCQMCWVNVVTCPVGKKSLDARSATHNPNHLNQHLNPNGSLDWKSSLRNYFCQFRLVQTCTTLWRPFRRDCRTIITIFKTYLKH